MSLYCSTPSIDLVGAAASGNMSNSFSFCPYDSSPINVNYVLSELEGVFDPSSLHALLVPHDSIANPFGFTGDGYCDFDILSAQFPAISPDVAVTDDSNSCESVLSEQFSNHGGFCELGGRISPDESSFCSKLQEVEMKPATTNDQGLHLADHGKVTSTSSTNCWEMLQVNEKCGVELVQLLLACAQAIAAGEVKTARQLVSRLRSHISSKGSSMERMATYFTQALAECVGMDITDHHSVGFSEFPLAEESWIAYQVFYASCPYLIVTHFTANQAILEAFEGERTVHVVDLDIKQGLQWPSLIQALSLRDGGPPQLRITGVAGANPDFPSMMATRNRLLEFADMFNVPLEFTILTENMEDLQPWMMEVRDQEILAINCVSSLHQLIDHPRRPLQSFLQMIHSLEPSVVTIVEQDANHHQDFFPRFVGGLHYYSSMFDSIAASLSSSLAEREIVERLLLGREIINIVGREGDQRLERHQTADQWIHYMTEAGFQLYPLSPHSILQAKFLLSMYPISKFFIVNEEGYLSVGWQDNPLYAVSCWC